MAGIYVHIPFCVKKCAYCDFVSFPAPHRAAEYAAALENEIELQASALSGKSFGTLFVGGGTPSVLPPTLLKSIIAALRNNFKLNLKEATIECNPGTVDESKLSTYRELGFDRISFGVQTANDELLRGIGRIHTFAEAVESIAMARRTGFENINADLMYGLPNQTTKDYLDSIQKVANLGVEHISAYSLILEEGTPLYNAVLRGETDVPDEDACFEMHTAGKKMLESLGFQRYEISNYAKRGRQCLHNLNYWNNGEYVGLGVAAHSAMNIKGEWTRWSNQENLNDYIFSIECGRLPFAQSEKIQRSEEMFECVMLGLRKIEGVDRAKFSTRFGLDVCSAYPDAIRRLEEWNWMEITPSSLRLTERGLDMQNIALLEFMVDK